MGRRATRSLALLAGAGVLAACSSPGPNVSGEPPVTESGSASRPATPGPAPAPEAPAITATPRPQGDAEDQGPRVAEVLATDLEVPWGLAFLPDGAALVTERDSGRVLRVTPRGAVRQVGSVADALPQGEGGLLGVAVSPTFAKDRQVFLYASTSEDNRVLRGTLDAGRLGALTPIFTGIPNGFRHDGGRLAFGPDGWLYVSTGEIGEPDLAQDPESLAGKILRITSDGDPAPGNPDPDSPVFSIGHRNVQGLAFDDAGRLWASEFGDQTWDELNQVNAGSNYGWPLVEGSAGDGADPALSEPFAVWRTDEASPSGLAWLDGDLWMASLRGERLWQVPVTPEGRLGEPVDHFVGEYDRLRTVVVAPDGRLWVTTSNRDGRTTPGPDDDRILVIEP